ncbi:MAG: AAA family ATPase [Bacteroidota bacterium]
MQLKKLEIKGFKSFANETVLNFEEDVIGVVGPNGSGKSNIVDAIRWVLGEQKSRELRLEKMSDVIFNGTKKKKQSGMAQVTLTFENTKNILPTEYQTVSISRVLYRSGESEYRLNGIPCRLKDITALFLDTGIGSNSYAIIALGMVDDILADKENARRKMFEQAAGISKYKNRKKQTLNKLKNTTADLDRVEDLLFEIENNLKDLEKQAKRTQRFFDLKTKYKNQTINMSLRKVASFKEAYVENEKKLQVEQDRYSGLNANSQAEEAKLEKERKENLDKEKSVSSFQLKLNEVVNKIRERENQKNILEQKILFIDQNAKKLQRQIDASKERVEELQIEIQDYHSSFNDEKTLEEKFESSLKGYKTVYDEVQSKYDLIKTDVDKMAQEQQLLERALFELEKTSAITQNSIENIKQELELNETEKVSKLEGVNLLNSELANILSILGNKQEKLEQLQAKEIERKENEEKAEQSLRSLEEDLNGINRKLDAKENEHNLLKSLIDKLEGFPDSIKFSIYTI